MKFRLKEKTRRQLLAIQKSGMVNLDGAECQDIIRDFHDSLLAGVLAYRQELLMVVGHMISVEPTSTSRDLALDFINNRGGPEENQELKALHNLVNQLIPPAPDKLEFA